MPIDYANIPMTLEHRDAVTSATSPRPWRVEGPFTGQRETKRQHGFREYANVLDRNGIYIAQNLTPGTAALIVAAVNERDRLRDIVRRLAESLDTAIAVLGLLVDTYRVSPPCPKPLHDTLCGVDLTELLREAREAIGEGE